MQVGDLVKWVIPNEEGTMIDHLGIVLKLGRPRGKPTVLAFMVDFHRANWYFENELEIVNAICR